MLVLAHRGYHARHPENTLEAFAAAAREGVDGIETDVRLAADGTPLLVHDRVTPQGRAVSALTREALARDFGHAVPRLDEALDAQPGLLWNVEIKHPEAVRATVAVLAPLVARRRLLVTSFRHDVVAAVAAALPGLDCGLLCAHRPLNLATVTQGAAPNVRTLVWDYNILDPLLAAEARERGWRTAVYGAVTEDEHRACAEIGLDALITDYPERVRFTA
ncbi:MAG: glycerophosphodiester phosphodiesterase [Burkholderiales bacterium]